MSFDRISGLEDKIDIKEETKFLDKKTKELQKKYTIPAKDQTHESWALKKEKSFKAKLYMIYSRK
jgi:hypothetical protein